jgi:hypothetical protein
MGLRLLPLHSSFEPSLRRAGPAPGSSPLKASARTPPPRQCRTPSWCATPALAGRVEARCKCSARSRWLSTAAPLHGRPAGAGTPRVVVNGHPPTQRAARRNEQRAADESTVTSTEGPRSATAAADRCRSPAVPVPRPDGALGVAQRPERERGRLEHGADLTLNRNAGLFGAAGTYPATSAQLRLVLGVASCRRASTTSTDR